MEKVIISEEKIKEFIAKNDKRVGARLDNYKELIERLINCDIKLNSIYEFIFENDKDIGNKANFYKYVKKNFNISKKKATTTIPKTPKPKSLNLAQPNSNATPFKTPKDILSQEFDLLS